MEHLQCEFLFKRSYAQVLEILDLPYWKETDQEGNLIFKDLLTPTIWSSNSEQIKAILDLPYWKEKDQEGNLIYKDLLTPTIWSSNADQIQAILDLPYWNVPIYKHLLTPSIWSIKPKRITECIETLEAYGLERFISSSILKKSKKQIIALISYLIDKNILIVIEEKLNLIFNMAPCVMKEKYNINLKDLVEKYKEEKPLKLCLC